MATRIYDVSSNIIKVGSNDILYLSWYDPSASQLTSLPFGSAYNLRIFRKGSQTGTNLNGLWTSNPVSPFIFSQLPLATNGIYLNNTLNRALMPNYFYYKSFISSNGQNQIFLQEDYLDLSGVYTNQYYTSSNYGINWSNHTDINNAGITGGFIGNYICGSSLGDIIYYTTSSAYNTFNKSINYGTTFSQSNYPFASSIANIACDSTGNYVIIGGGGRKNILDPLSFSTTNLYFSNNAGTTWSVSTILNNYISGTFGTSSVHWITASMSDNGSILVLTFIPASATNQTYLCSTYTFNWSNFNDPNTFWNIWPISQNLSSLGSSPTAEVISLGLSANGQLFTCSFYGTYLDSSSNVIAGSYVIKSQLPFTTYSIINSLTSSPYNSYIYNICLSSNGQYQYAIKLVLASSQFSIIYSSDFGSTWTTNYNNLSGLTGYQLTNIAISDNAYYLNAYLRPTILPITGRFYNSANGYDPGVDISYNPTVPGGNRLKVYLDPSGNVWYNNSPTIGQLPINNNIFEEGGYFGIIQRNYQISNYVSPSTVGTYFNNIENPDLNIITTSIPYNYFLSTPSFGSVNPSIPGPYGQNMSYDWFAQYDNITKPQLAVPDISYISQLTIELALPVPLPASGNIDLFCETTFDLSAGPIFYADPSLVTYFVDPSLNSNYYYGKYLIELSSNVIQLVDASFNNTPANQIISFETYFYGDDTNRTIGCRWQDPSLNALTNSITGSPYNLRLYKRQIGIEPSQIEQWFPTGEVPPFNYQNDISMGWPIEANFLTNIDASGVMAFFFDAAGNVSYNSTFTSVSNPFTAADSGGYILVVQRNYEDNSGNSYYTTIGGYLNYISPPPPIFLASPNILQVDTTAPYLSTYYNTGLANMNYQWSIVFNSGSTVNVGTNQDTLNISSLQQLYNGYGNGYYQCAITYQFNYPPYNLLPPTPFYEITPVTTLINNGILTVNSAQYEALLCYTRTNFPPPPWSRFSLTCGTDGVEYTPEQLQMRRKAEVLQYYTNKVNMQKSTKAQQWSFIARGLSTPNNSYATQTVNYTNPNTTGFPNNNRAILLPAQCTNQPLRALSFPTYCSDVPGRPMLLTFDPRVPLIRYKKIYTYPTTNDPATSDQINSQ